MIRRGQVPVALNWDQRSQGGLRGLEGVFSREFFSLSSDSLQDCVGQIDARWILSNSLSDDRYKALFTSRPCGTGQIEVKFDILHHELGERFFRLGLPIPFTLLVWVHAPLFSSSTSLLPPSNYLHSLLRSQSLSTLSSIFHALSLILLVPCILSSLSNLLRMSHRFHLPLLLFSVQLSSLLMRRKRAPSPYPRRPSDLTEAQRRTEAILKECRRRIQCLRAPWSSRDDNNRVDTPAARGKWAVTYMDSAFEAFAGDCPADWKVHLKPGEAFVLVQEGPFVTKGSTPPSRPNIASWHVRVSVRRNPYVIQIR